MRYVVTVDLFDGFECSFEECAVMDCDDPAEAERRTRAFFKGDRPSLEDVKVQTLDEWITSRMATF